jgi:branched-chain amino acid transport system substrate-binding protein
MKSKSLYALIALLCAAGLFIGGCSKRQAAADLNLVVLIPLTGPAAEYSRFSKMGFDLGIQKATAEGLSVKVKFVDTKSNPGEATTALQQELLLSRPDAVIPMLSSVTKAVDPILRQNGLLSIANAVAAPGLANPAEARFRMFPTSETVSEFAAKAAKDAGAKTALIVYVNDEYGLGCLTTFKAKASEASLQLLAGEPFSAVEKDFRTQWSRLLALKPDSVFVAGYGPGYVAVLQQLAETRYAGVIVTDFTLTAPPVFNAVSGVREGTLIIAPDTKPEFEREVLKAFPDAGYFVNIGTAYDAILGIAVAHHTSQQNQQPIAQVLGKIEVKNGAFGSVRFDGNGDQVIPLSVYVVKDGKIVRR